MNQIYPDGYIDTSLPLFALHLHREKSILVLSADYLIWSTDFSEAIRDIQKQTEARKHWGMDLHVLGKSSERTKQELNKLGINLMVIDQF